MADLTQSLYSAEEKLRTRGIQAKVIAKPADGREADPEVVACLQGEEPSDWNADLRRNFLRRLTLALVTYGSSAPRTEYLIQSAADRLHVNVDIAVLNSLVILLFPHATDKFKEKIHMLKVAGEMDVDKLQRVDELANSVGLCDTPVMMGQWQLQAIVNSPSSFGSWWWQLLGFVLSAPTAALLFFSGNYWDAILSLSLGLGVGIIYLLAPRLPVLGNIVEFVAALVVSFLARLFAFYLMQLEVCFFAMAISGLVWLLPGQNLTIGVTEVVEGAVMTGSARITKALVSSLLLGFGLVIGERLVWWVPKLEPTPCDDPNISRWFLIFWLLGFMFAANIFLRARLGQWWGMCVVAGVGYVVKELADQHFGDETSTVLSSLAIGLAATLMSFMVRDIPSSMILAGIQVLLPGGIGVQGIDIIMKNDVLSGIEFVMNMIIICLSITVGLLLSKLLLHDGFLGASRVIHRRNQTLLHEEEESVAGNEREEDQQMAI